MSLAIFSASPGMAQDAPPPKPADAPQTTTPAATPAAPADAPTALPTPSITGPLAGSPPIILEAGPLGKLSLNGIVSGMGLFQSNSVPGNTGPNGALSNGQVWIQKTTGWWQFYVQAGAYQISSLGTPFISTEKTITDLYGPVPVAFVKLLPTKTTSIQFGLLPTLMGAEYTFSFQNMNIERGLLWNQENAITRGVQINQGIGKYLTASFSWNDNYYSNRYSGLSGSLTYTKGAHSLAFIGMGYLGQTNWSNLATPVQNNGTMYVAMYTYTKNGWVIQPYVQYNGVPTNPTIGVPQGSQAWGGAILASKTLKKGWSMAGRFEYISSSGSIPSNSFNMLYGSGSAAWSLTATPTYQYQKFFTRGDISFVQATSFTPGSAFGSLGTLGTQTRGVVEIGFLF
ncbi:MAG TPA: outer membrane beta-barrel protein [Terriglobales bacterium]|jgi:hypothetical protein